MWRDATPNQPTNHSTNHSIHHSIHLVITQGRLVVRRDVNVNVMQRTSRPAHSVTHELHHTSVAPTRDDPWANCLRRRREAGSQLGLRRR